MSGPFEGVHGGYAWGGTERGHLVFRSSGVPVDRCWGSSYLGPKTGLLAGGIGCRGVGKDIYGK